MIPMNFMKSKAGFTLVELIVVIAILGILAGIAVPAYSGYIKKANSAKDTQVLSAIYTAATSACVVDGDVTRIEVNVSAATETKGKVTSVEVTAGSVEHVFTFSTSTNKWTTTDTNHTGCANDFTTFMGTTQPAVVSDGTYATGATWSAGTWTVGVTNPS